uniref:Uncharacterized protein n=1 Tax=Magallana gigas TaxID=29159 RepID=A0A8W8IAR6_MAGGI
MEQNLDVDEIWRALKPWGRYQIRQMGIMLVANLPSSINLLAVVFIGYRPQFQCAEISPINHNSLINSTYDVTYDECSVTMSYNQSNSSQTITSCPNGYEYNAHDDISFVTEGFLLSSVTLCVETVPMEYRFLAEVAGITAWTTGLVMLTPLAYIMKAFSWRYLQLLLALLSVYSLVEYWVTNSLTYTGLNLITPTLYGNRFVNFFLLCAIEYFSALTEFLLLNRNSGYGYASGFARIGGVLAPFAYTFHSYVAWGPGVVFSIMCFLSAIMIFHLPETRGRELPTSIEELKMCLNRISFDKQPAKFSSKVTYLLL